jgi:hypothetical protein
MLHFPPHVPLVGKKDGRKQNGISECYIQFRAKQRSGTAVLVIEKNKFRLGRIN